MSESFPHLASPWWLLALLLLPLLAWLHHRRPTLGALTYSRLPLDTGGDRRGARSGGGSTSHAGFGAPPHPGKGEQPVTAPQARGTMGGMAAVRLHLPFYARLAGLACLVLAMARPQLGFAWEESLTEGIDIELVLDVSGSMAAEDFQPQNRVTVAKGVVKEFVAGRTGDRIGLVVFSGTAMNRAPLTTDHAMLEQLIDAVDLNSLPDGTAIGVALATAAARLRSSPAKSRVIVLVTDGVNNMGEIDPLSAAALCKGLGIRVYSVGVGTNGRVIVPFPVRNPATGEREIRRVPMTVSIDEALLQRISSRTGGQFFKAGDRESLRHIFRSIDRLEKTPLKVKRYVRYREGFPPLAWSGLALLFLPFAAAGFSWTAEP